MSTCLNVLAVAQLTMGSTDEVFKASSYLLEDLEDKETGKKFSATGAALQKAMSTDQVYFAWLENNDNAYRFARYGACIQGTSLWDPPTTILQGKLKQAYESYNVM